MFQKIQQGLAFLGGQISIAGHLGAGIEPAGLSQGDLQLLPGEAGADVVQGSSPVARARMVAGKAAQAPGQVSSRGLLGRGRGRGEVQPAGQPQSGQPGQECRKKPGKSPGPPLKKVGEKCGLNKS